MLPSRDAVFAKIRNFAAVIIIKYQNAAWHFHAGVNIGLRSVYESCETNEDVK